MCYSISTGYPIVKFKSSLEKVIGPETWVVKTGGGGTVTRRQLPLRLAWAVSIHKSQVSRHVSLSCTYSCNSILVLPRPCYSLHHGQRNLSKSREHYKELSLSLNNLCTHCQGLTIKHSDCLFVCFSFSFSLLIETVYI